IFGGRWSVIGAIGGVSVIIIYLFAGWGTEAERVHIQVARKRRTEKDLCFGGLVISLVNLGFLQVISFSFYFNNFYLTAFNC
ncbi:hypothetical protein, partial [uncultured Brachyspira sp.]|uniref:hypothetical protein n=1 Tax=uncultured Brachyspira sp. TaxID=221953 RepID=UPI0026026C55